MKEAGPRRRGDGARGWLYSILLHGAVLAAVALLPGIRSAPPMAPSAPRVIEARAVDAAQVAAEVERLKARDAAAAEARRRAEREAEAARRKRQAEERRLVELRKRQAAERKRLAAAQQAQAEARRKAEAERRRAEQARREAQAEARRKAEAEAARKAAEAAKQAAEEKARREAEAARQAAEQARREAEAARKAAEEARLRAEAEARQRELERALAEEAAAREAAAERRRQQRQIDRFIAGIQSQVESVFINPEPSEDLACTIRIRLSPAGDVLAAEVIRSSGSPAFDAQAERAVYKASPLPVPADPQLYRDLREVDLVFHPRGG